MLIFNFISKITQSFIYFRLFLTLFSIALLFLNIYFALCLKTINKLDNFEFKNVDNYSFFLSNKLYKEIYSDSNGNKQKKIKISLINLLNSPNINNNNNNIFTKIKK